MHLWRIIDLFLNVVLLLFIGRRESRQKSNMDDIDKESLQLMLNGTYMYCNINLHVHMHVQVHVKTRYISWEYFKHLLHILLYV